AICGSPRKGNTEAMLKRLLDGAKSKGAAIELIRLGEKKIEPCAAVCDCFETGHACPIEDEMQQIIAKMLSADAIVLGSPDYFKNVSGIMKNFMDRTIGLCGKQRWKGNKAAVAAVGGQNLHNVEFCEKALAEFVKDHGMKLAGSIKATAEKAGEIADNKEVMQECFALGETLVGGAADD
ncbi:MAG: flavodoxin family protein, partial [Candidatus Diapherotrites archaeon]|nr:flavodoxin family protein [Candidatus Diapherotrites archaeon]